MQNGFNHGRKASGIGIILLLAESEIGKIQLVAGLLHNNLHLALTDILPHEHVIAQDGSESLFLLVLNKLIILVTFLAVFLLFLSLDLAVTEQFI